MLCFFPSDLSLNQKMRYVGLAEAISSFTTTFTSNPNELCESLFCDNKRHVLLQVEPGYWAVLTVNLVHSTPIPPSDPDKIERIKDFTLYEDYNLSYKILQSILSTAYQTFRVFQGKMDDIVNRAGVDSLRATLDMFFARYLPTLPFYSPNNTAQVNIFSILDGIHFLPVDQNVFLSIQSFINQTTNFFNKKHTQVQQTPTTINTQKTPIVTKQGILATMFFFDHYMIFSGGISHEEARIVTNYIPQLLEDRFKELQVGTSSKRLSFTTFKCDGFLTGPENITNKETRFTAPRVFLGENEQQTETHIIVFKHNRITVLFFITSSVFQKLKFYTTLAEIITPELGKLNSIVADGINFISSFDDVYKYIYFNHMNLAIKTSLAKKHSIVPSEDELNQDHDGLLPSSNTPTMREALQIVSHIHGQFQKSNDGLKEMYMRTRKDSWVVGKYFGEREFYILFDQKNYSLMEVQEQVHKISNIFFSASSNKD